MPNRTEAKFDSLVKSIVPAAYPPSDKALEAAQGFGQAIEALPQIQWMGVLRNIGTQRLLERGARAVVYLSTTKDLLDEEYQNIRILFREFAERMHPDKVQLQISTGEPAELRQRLIHGPENRHSTLVWEGQINHEYAKSR